MRRLVFLLVSLSFLFPSPILSDNGTWRPWNCQKYKEIIEITTKFHPTKRMTFKLKWKATWKEFQIALKKGDYETAEKLQRAVDHFLDSLAACLIYSMASSTR